MRVDRGLGRAASQRSICGCCDLIDARSFHAGCSRECAVKAAAPVSFTLGVAKGVTDRTHSTDVESISANGVIPSEHLSRAITSDFIPVTGS